MDMSDLPGLVSVLIPGLGTALIAIISGAGGSALLELYWKPRRDRRRAAALIHADIILNMQMILFHAELRKNAPRKIPQDLKLSRLGYDTAGEMVSELPTDLLRPVVLLYNRIDDLNRNVDLYSKALDEFDTLDPSSPRREKLQHYMNSIIDVFNTGMDKAWDTCKLVGGQIEKLARIKVDKNEPRRDFSAEAKTLLRERQLRIQALAAMDEPNTSRVLPTPPTQSADGQSSANDKPRRRRGK